MRTRVVVSTAIASISAACQAAAPAEPLSPAQNLANVTMGVIFILGFAAGVAAILLLYAVLRPNALRRNADQLRAKPWLPFVIGIVASAAATSIVVISGQMLGEQGGIVLIAVAIPVAYFTFAGTAAVAHEIGDRILASLTSRHAGSVFACVLAGSVLLTVIGLVPFLGQLIQLVVLILGLGVGLNGLKR